VFGLEFAASTAAAFLAAFAGAYFGYRLSERSAQRARKSESDRRARLAATTALAHCMLLAGAAQRIPAGTEDLSNPDVELDLFVLDASMIQDAMRALTDLPSDAGEKFSALFTRYSSLLASCRMARSASVVVRKSNPEADQEGDMPDWAVVRNWKSQDAENPLFQAAWKELEVSREAFLGEVKSVLEALNKIPKWKDE
jgi:hypothetical protein